MNHPVAHGEPCGMKRTIAEIGKVVESVSRSTIGKVLEGMKRLSISRKPWMVCWAMALAVVGGLFYSGKSWAGALPLSGRVAEVFDGDTILLDSGEKIRYLGIDAPELTHDGNPADCHGTEAKEVNAGFVFHKRVTLQYDKEHQDVHGRLLAYVFSPEGKCVNAELLRGGHAYVYRTSEGFSKLSEFLSCQRDAMHSRRGMWGNCPVKPAAYYLGNKRSFVLHRSECAWAKAASPRNLTHFLTRFAGLEEGYHPCRRCKP